MAREAYEFGKKIRRMTVFDQYSAHTFACSCCGVTEMDFLSIDHKDGNGNKISKELGIPRGGDPLYRWLIRHGFPTGFQVLCLNCNLSKAKSGRCAHETMDSGHPSQIPVAG